MPEVFKYGPLSLASTPWTSGQWLVTCSKKWFDFSFSKAHWHQQVQTPPSLVLSPPCRPQVAGGYFLVLGLCFMQSDACGLRPLLSLSCNYVTDSDTRPGTRRIIAIHKLQGLTNRKKRNWIALKTIYQMTIISSYLVHLLLVPVVSPFFSKFTIPSVWIFFIKSCSKPLS